MYLSGPQLENIPWWGKNILRRVQTYVWGAKYNKYNKINNNIENFREARYAARIPILECPFPRISQVTSHHRICAILHKIQVGLIVTKN